MMNKLLEAVKDYAKAAKRLTYEAKRREIDDSVLPVPIADDFDHLMRAIDNWEHEATIIAKLVDIQKGDKVHIAIYDVCEGNAKVVSNDIEKKHLIIRWIDEPTTCYPHQRLVVGEDGLIAMSYDEVCEISLVYYDSDIYAILDDEFEFPLEYKTAIVKRTLKKYEADTDTDIQDVIENAINEVAYENSYSTRLDRRLEKAI